jgi:hypothetical protein
MWSLVLLAIFVWPWLSTWAILVFFIAGTAVPPLNDVTPLTPERQWLGYAAFVILAPHPDAAAALPLGGSRLAMSVSVRLFSRSRCLNALRSAPVR